MQGAEEHLGSVEAGLACLTKPAGMKVALTQKVHSCLAYVVVHTCDPAASCVLFNTKTKSACLDPPRLQLRSKRRIAWHTPTHCLLGYVVQCIFAYSAVDKLVCSLDEMSNEQ